MDAPLVGVPSSGSEHERLECLGQIQGVDGLAFPAESDLDVEQGSAKLLARGAESQPVLFSMLAHQFENAV
jgi:hypothetical protein